MPPVSPCGLVVDFVRSCFEGRWRFFPRRPDLLVSGFHFVVSPETPSIEGFHPFGSGVWTKDGFTYPELEVGEVMTNGHEWYDGAAPVFLPPEQQIYPTTAFGEDFNVADPPVSTRNGFAEQCYVVSHPGIDLDLDKFFRPNIEDCCWQRLLAKMLQALSGDVPHGVDVFLAAVNLLWGGALNVVIDPLATIGDRFAWIEYPDFQVLFRVGTQTFAETYRQCWHGLGAPVNYGIWSTSPEWLDASSVWVGRLQFHGFDANKPTTIIAQSRGSAVSWILARRMTDFAPERDVEVLLFECPKVGDNRMVAMGNVNRRRCILHEDDYVPLVPVNLDVIEQLRALFPGVPLDPMTRWKNFPVYQIIGGGRPPRFGPAPSLPWQVMADLLRLAILNQAPAPIAAHILSSQVAALAACCDAPIFPFTDELWNSLFGDAPPPAPGGRMIGGGDGLQRIGGGGLAFGGHGKSFPPIGEGGIALGGGGLLERCPAILMEDSGYVLQETFARICLE